MASIQPYSPDDHEAISSVQVRPSAPPVVTQWLNSLGNGDVPLLTVEASQDYRRIVYGWCSAIDLAKWQTRGIRSEVVHNLLELESIWKDLLTVESFLVDEPLRSMVDQRFYLISDLFRVILEARFQVTEGANPDHFFQAITQWIRDEKLTPKQEALFVEAKVSRRVQVTEQLDLCFFLVTLAAQSGLISRLTLALDHVDRAATAGISAKKTYLKDLDDVTFGATRWEKLGSPLGIILGVDRLAPLETPTKLGKLIKAGQVYRQPV
jgi:hypothetical protein